MNGQDTRFQWRGDGGYEEPGPDATYVVCSVCKARWFGPCGNEERVELRCPGCGLRTMFAGRREVALAGDRFRDDTIRRIFRAMREPGWSRPLDDD